MLFDYTILQLIWWVLVGAVLIIYATTAGFDFGVTLMLPFLKRRPKFSDNDLERRVVLNTISATWDGNQTWLVFAGGALFAVWPGVYTTMFSGMYALMLVILWSFFLRPPGFDYRGKLANPTWRKMWDWALFLSAFLPVLMFGLIFGNLFVGVPFYFDPISMRSFYEGNFLSLLNPMGIVAALTSLFMILMHGTAYLNRRTTSGLQNHFRQLQLNFSMVFLILFTVCGLLLMYKVNGFTLVHSPANAPAHALSNVVTRGVGVWYQNMNLHPWKWAGPIMVYVAALLSLLTMRLGNGGLSFWLSGTAVAGTVMSAGFALFPFIEPSSAMPDQSITMWNATSSPLNLMGMLYVGGVMLVIIFAYKFWGYSRVWGKQKTLSVKDIEADDHTFY